MRFFQAFKAFRSVHPSLDEARWVLKHVAECLIQPIPVAGVQSGVYDDRGARLFMWLGNGDVKPCTSSESTEVLSLRFTVDPDDVFAAIRALAPELLPANAETDAARPSPFRTP